MRGAGLYRRWGALAKVAQLDLRQPEVAPQVSQAHLPTVETPLEHLDLATVIRMSQAAVAGELLLAMLTGFARSRFRGLRPAQAPRLPSR